MAVKHLLKIPVQLFGDFCKNKVSTELGDIICETDLLANETKAISDNLLEFHPWEIKTVKIIKN